MNNFVKKAAIAASFVSIFYSCGHEQSLKKATGGDIVVSINGDIKKFDIKSEKHLHLLENQGYNLSAISAIHGYMFQKDATETTFGLVSKKIEEEMRKKEGVYVTPILLESRGENVDKFISDQAELIKNELKELSNKKGYYNFDVKHIFAGVSQGSAIAHELFKDEKSFPNAKYISIMGSPMGCFFVDKAMQIASMLFMIGIKISDILPNGIKELSSENSKKRFNEKDLKNLNQENSLFIAAYSEEIDDVIKRFIRGFKGFAPLVKNLLFANSITDGCFSIENQTGGVAKNLDDIKKIEFLQKLACVNESTLEGLLISDEFITYLEENKNLDFFDKLSNVESDKEKVELLKSLRPNDYPQFTFLEGTNHIEPLGWGTIGSEEDRKNKAEKIADQIAKKIFSFTYDNICSEEKIESKIEGMKIE